MNATAHLLHGVVAFAVLALGTVTTTLANDDGTLPYLPAPINDMSVEQWDAFSGTLRNALASGHDGLQIGAMRMAIQYSDYVDIKGSVIDLMRIYRNHSDEHVRQLAVVTLGSVDSQMVINYLRLHESYETSKVVRRTMRAVIADA